MKKIKFLKKYIIYDKNVPNEIALFGLSPKYCKLYRQAVLKGNSLEDVGKKD